MTHSFRSSLLACLFLTALLTVSACSPASTATRPSQADGNTPAPVQSALAAQNTAVPAQPTTVAAPKMKVDACALITKADAEKILGKTVNDPEIPIQSSETFDVTSCAYRVQGATAVDNVTLIVIIPVSQDAADAKASFDDSKKTVPDNYNAAPVDVTGLGDGAFWVAGSGNQLFVLQRKAQIVLRASTQKGETPSAEIISLARLVLSRLP